MIGWKLARLSGRAAAAYIGFIEKHNVAYKVQPMGIGGLQQQEHAMAETHVAMDEMEMHESIAKRVLGVK